MFHKLPEPSLIEVGVSYGTDVDAIVSRLADQVSVSDACCLIVLLPDGIDLDAFAVAANRCFAGVPVFGCTTAGQITPQGYEDDAVLLIALPKAHFRCASMLMSPLNPLSIKKITQDAEKLATQFQKTADWSRLALLFTDGLSKQEDVLVAGLEAVLHDLPIFGGSAGNGLRFRDTFVFHQGKFHTNAAVMLFLETNLEFRGIGFDHFLPTEYQMVVTDALPEERVVLEINGAPAAEEYARVIGVRVEDLSPQVFAENPVLVRNNALYHVRAIQKAHENGALSFLSAIDDGLLLTLGKGQEVLRTLKEGLDVRDALGKPPNFILGFDCFLRRLEIDGKGLTREVSDILTTHQVIGFNTYGEQHCGVHVNQTFVGVAFFQPRKIELS